MKSDFPEVPCKNPLCKRWFKPAWPWNQFCSDSCRTAYNSPLNPNHSDAPVRLYALLKSLGIEHPLFKAAQSAIQSVMAVRGNKSKKRAESRARTHKQTPEQMKASILDLAKPLDRYMRRQDIAGFDLANGTFEVSGRRMPLPPEIECALDRGGSIYVIEAETPKSQRRKGTQK